MLVNNFINNLKQSTACKKIRAVLCNSFNYLHKKSFFGLFKNTDEKFFKFIFVGLLNTFVSYMLYTCFVFVGLKANMALVFQYLFGILWNFKTTGCIVFKNNNNRLIFKFFFCYIITFSINSLFLYMLTKLLNDYIAQAILVLPIALLSFTIMKFWVFK